MGGGAAVSRKGSGGWGGGGGKNLVSEVLVVGGKRLRHSKKKLEWVRVLWGECLFLKEVVAFGKVGIERGKGKVKGGLS